MAVFDIFNIAGCICCGDADGRSQRPAGQLRGADAASGEVRSIEVGQPRAVARETGRADGAGTEVSAAVALDQGADGVEARGSVPQRYRPTNRGGRDVCIAGH